MNTNSILVSLEEVKKLLIITNLLGHENTIRPRSVMNSKFSSDFLRVMYSDDYEEIFKTAMKNFDYDFVLFDDSFLQFSALDHKDGIEKGKIRYAYYPNPRSYLTYSEFLLNIETSYDEAGSIFEEEYGQYIAEAKLKSTITPIRYDYDCDAYDENFHPISHLHIGLEENVRIPISKILTPQAFLIIVIKNMYLDYWKNALSDDVFVGILKHVKRQCPPLESDMFTEFEQLQSYLY